MIPAFVNRSTITIGEPLLERNGSEWKLIYNITWQPPDPPQGNYFCNLFVNRGFDSHKNIYKDNKRICEERKQKLDYCTGGIQSKESWLSNRHELRARTSLDPDMSRTQDKQLKTEDGIQHIEKKYISKTINR